VGEGHAPNLTACPGRAAGCSVVRRMEQVGRTRAMTVVSTTPRWWAWWLRFNWTRARLMRPLRPRRRSRRSKRVLALASITFAHWSLLDRLPPGRPRRASRRFPRGLSYLVFQSNFNGTRDLYLETFSVVVRWKMRLLWAGCCGVPDLIPISRYQAFAKQQDIAPVYYYSAYPEETTKTIGAALELRERFEAFAPRVESLSAERFAAEYDEFVTRVHTLL
jgi:hypothetical protein